MLQKESLISKHSASVIVMACLGTLVIGAVIAEGWVENFRQSIVKRVGA